MIKIKLEIDFEDFMDFYEKYHVDELTYEELNELFVYLDCDDVELTSRQLADIFKTLRVDNYSDLYNDYFIDIDDYEDPKDAEYDLCDELSMEYCVVKCKDRVIFFE